MKLEINKDEQILLLNIINFAEQEDFLYGCSKEEVKQFKILEIKIRGCLK